MTEAPKHAKVYYGTKKVLAWRAVRLTDGEIVDDPNAMRKIRESGAMYDVGYRVMYPDDYLSWSPGEAFEDAYREDGAMDFSGALRALKEGCRVARQSWAPDVFLTLHRDEDDTILMHRPNNKPHNTGVIPSREILSDDWGVVDN